jgi:pyrimidine operon attenuation protein/uracil phosphoribosyltransferase
LTRHPPHRSPSSPIAAGMPARSVVEAALLPFASTRPLSQPREAARCATPDGSASRSMRPRLSGATLGTELQAMDDPNNLPQSARGGRAARQILDAEGVRRALTRIAHEILERHGGTADLVLVGMRSRGVPIARRLADLISRFEGTTVDVGELDVTMFRDDLEIRGTRPSIQPSSIPRDLTDARVVLVDDVLYTGRTVRAALDALMSFGRASQVQLAVVVDRGHRELPVRADYVGKNLPTSRDESVEVRLVEVDGLDEVVLLARPSTAADRLSTPREKGYV